MVSTIRKNGNLIFNRKANAVLDGILVLVVLVVVSIFSVFGYMILSELNTDMQADDLLTNETKEIMSETTSYYPSFMDSVFIFILVLLWGMVLVASFMIDSHPVFFIFSLILIICLLIAAAFLSNGYQELMEDEFIVSYAIAFPMTNFVMSHLVQTILAISFSILIVMFAKSNM
jgi:hypothetical protein